MPGKRGMHLKLNMKGYALTRFCLASTSASLHSAAVLWKRLSLNASKDVANICSLLHPLYCRNLKQYPCLLNVHIDTFHPYGPYAKYLVFYLLLPSPTLSTKVVGFSTVMWFFSTPPPLCGWHIWMTPNIRVFNLRVQWNMCNSWLNRFDNPVRSFSSWTTRQRKGSFTAS